MILFWSLLACETPVEPTEGWYGDPRTGTDPDTDIDPGTNPDVPVTPGAFTALWFGPVGDSSASVTLASYTGCTRVEDLADLADRNGREAVVIDGVTYVATGNRAGVVEPAELPEMPMSIDSGNYHAVAYDEGSGSVVWAGLSGAGALVAYDPVLEQWSTASPELDNNDPFAMTYTPDDGALWALTEGRGDDVELIELDLATGVVSETVLTNFPARADDWSVIRDDLQLRAMSGGLVLVEPIGDGAIRLYAIDRRSGIVQRFCG